MQVTPIPIEPQSFEAAAIREFAEMVSDTSPLGVVVALQPEMYKGLLANALRDGAPADLVEMLFESDGQGWTLCHGGRKRLNYWRTSERWLLAPDGAGTAGPIWLTEPQRVLDELSRLLEVFLPANADAAIDYLFTEEADRRPEPRHIEPRPFLKRRFLSASGESLVLHHRLYDGTVEGEPVRTTEYVLEGPDGCARFAQTVAFGTMRLVAREGPETIADVGF
jgi:hypothetical protein